MTAQISSDGSHYQSIWKWLHRTPHRLGYADAGAVSTRYLEAGDPALPKVLMLHGTAGSLENFSANITEFSKHFHIFAIDMLGCGWTAKPDFPYTARDYAGHARDFLKAMGIAKASLVGVSLGSWVAMRLARDTPDMVDRIVAVAPAGLTLPPEETAATIDKVRNQRSKAAAEPSWESIRTIFGGIIADPDRILDDLIAVRLEIYRNPALQANMPNLLHMLNLDFTLDDDDLRALPGEVLSIASSDYDDIYKKNAYHIRSVRPDSPVVEIAGTNHWAQFEKPDIFNPLAIDFLLGRPIAQAS